MLVECGAGSAMAPSVALEGRRNDLQRPRFLARQSNSPGSHDEQAMTCVMASRSYSSPDRYVSRKALSRATRSGITPTDCSPTDTP